MSLTNLKICVCGAGTMGSGIAQTAAMSGFYTIVYDVEEAVIKQSQIKIEEGLQKMLAREKITVHEKEAISTRIFYTTQLKHCKADVVIEAIIENAAAKIALLNNLAHINSNKTIFASNTSSLSLTTLAEFLPIKERFLGMHFFNPAPIMKLVEIVTTASVTPTTIQLASEVAKQMQKVAVVCKDAPGFIVNRVARPFYTEALRLAEAGYAVETIDYLMEGAGFKLGPFRLMDFIGNDINYTVSCSVYEQMACPERLKPSPLQKEMVEKGHLGKKSGKGFYTYGAKSIK